MDGRANAGNSAKPIVLVTNDDGINAPGIRAIISALVESDICQVFVCAPDQEKSATAHSLTTRDALEVGPVEIPGTTAWEVSGTPADCVSLALSAHLLPAKPALVISGINKGSNCGYHIIYSGTVAGAREAFMSGVPAIALSLDWKSRLSQESHFAEAAQVCLPLIRAKLRDIEERAFPKGCFFNVDVPCQPKQNKGFRSTRQGSSRVTPHWVKVTKRRTGAQMAGATPMPGMMAGMGAHLAQLGLAASVAGAARRSKVQQQEQEQEEKEEEESRERRGAPAPAGKEHYRNEMGDYDVGEADADVDYTALAQGWITVTPLGLYTQAPQETVAAAADWLATNLS